MKQMYEDINEPHARDVTEPGQKFNPIPRCFGKNRHSNPEYVIWNLFQRPEKPKQF
jgi:hypothetical protein